MNYDIPFELRRSLGCVDDIIENRYLPIKVWKKNGIINVLLSLHAEFVPKPAINWNNCSTIPPVSITSQRAHFLVWNPVVTFWRGRPLIPPTHHLTPLRRSPSSMSAPIHTSTFFLIYFLRLHGKPPKVPSPNPFFLPFGQQITSTP